MTGTGRILITGAPRTGKTTSAKELARRYGTPVRHTDDLVHYGWSEASQAVSEWMNTPGPWIIEGVTVARAARKWLANNPDKPAPWDMFIVLTQPYETLSKGQETMGKGIETVLTGMGVHVERMNATDLLG